MAPSWSSRLRCCGSLSGASSSLRLGVCPASASRVASIMATVAAGISDMASTGPIKGTNSASSRATKAKLTNSALKASG